MFGWCGQVLRFNSVLPCFWGSLNKKTWLPQTHLGQIVWWYININFSPSKNVTSCGDLFSGGSSLATLLRWCSNCLLCCIYLLHARHIHYRNDCTNLRNLPPVFGVPAEENQDRKLSPCCPRKWNWVWLHWLGPMVVSFSQKKTSGS